MNFDISKSGDSSFVRFYHNDHRSGSDVVFAVLPFTQLNPALDASTLATILKNEGMSARVVYLNRLFAQKIKAEFYDAASATISLNALLGDWVFRDEVFEPMDNEGYLKSLLDRYYISSDLIPSAIHAKRLAKPFIETCLTTIDWEGVSVLCLVETFAKRDAVAGQLMASLALARATKRHFPHIKIVLAGPSTEQEMGRALADLPFLDFVCTADIYANVPPFIKKCLGGSAVNPSSDDATAFKRPRQVGASVSVLNLPIPSFDDYFELRGDGLPGCFESLPMETSKGCWWAERNHCTFCALPGSDVTFRSKRPEIALEELRVQVDRYRPKQIEMTDLIIDQKYFYEFFPALAKSQQKVEIFYETKAHLKREQLEMLSEAGVRKIQAGVESLSANTLRQMSKGVSVSKNLQFLNDCSELGIECYWNYLHSFPGETALDLLSAIPAIDLAKRLQPPATFQPVRVERFSPYWANPEKYGIDKVCPDRSYKMIYGDSDIDLANFAFYFEHEEMGIDHRQRSLAVARLQTCLDIWRQQAAH